MPAVKSNIEVECSLAKCNYFGTRRGRLVGGHLYLGKCPQCGSPLILDEEFLSDDGIEILFELGGADD